MNKLNLTSEITPDSYVYLGDGHQEKNKIIIKINNPGHEIALERGTKEFSLTIKIGTGQTDLIRNKNEPINIEASPRFENKKKMMRPLV